jgi:hypothetical protein
MFLRGLWRFFWWGGAGAPPYRGGTFRRGDPGRAFARLAPARTLSRADAARTFRGNPDVQPEASYETRVLRRDPGGDDAETVAFLFDFSNFPEVAAGGTLSSPAVPAVTGLTFGTPAVTAAELDGIPAGEAVQVTVTAGEDTEDGNYAVWCYATVGGSRRAVKGVVAVR